MANGVINSHGGRINSTRAFTLVELAGVILVITFLAILALPTLVRASQKTKLAVCQANLKQLGLALQAYTDAYQGQLPGPLCPLVHTKAQPGSNDQLCQFVSGSNASSSLAAIPDLECPAHQTTGSKILARSDYALNAGRRLGTPPFGRTGPPPLAPMHLADVRKTISPAECWAVADADKANVNPTLPGWKGLPYQSVHGKLRNQLYFDWHVDNQDNP